ncbi:M56 family metallopeptidase [Tsuneonella sp. HG222]
MTGWLIDTALYTGLLIGAVLVLRRPVGRAFGPGMAYALWALPLLRFVLPPIVLPASLAPQTPAADPALAYASGASSAADAAMLLAVPAEPVWSWMDFVLPVWIAGAVLLLSWRIASYHRMRRDLLAMAKPVGEAGRVRLVETPAIASPVAFGVVDKVVALPPRFMAMEDRTARDLAIAHELAHHRGRDILANFAAQPLLAMHWFNPLAWAGWRAMRRDQEAACDARVLEGRDASERVAYARLITGFAAGPRLALAAPMACPIIGEKSIIHRLRSLSMSDVSMRRRWLGRALFGAAAVALPLTASVSYAQGEVAEAEMPPSAAAPSGEAEAAEKQVRVFRFERKGGEHPTGDDAAAAAADEPGGKRIVRIRRPDIADGEVQVFEWSGDKPLSDEQRKKLDDMMAKVGDREFADLAKRGELLALRGEELAKRGEALGERHRQLALRFADIDKHMPLVEANCDKAGGEGSRSWTDEDGRKRIVICRRNMVAGAAMGLRQARNAIANNRDMSPEVRDEVLRELDSEIVRIEQKEG